MGIMSEKQVQGFTLIELLTVMAIIGVLASITVVSLSGSRARARDAERVSEVGTIVLAAELYRDACGRYPANITTLSGNSGCPSGITWQTFIGATVPVPPGGGNYGYATDGTGASFVVYVNLETNAPGLADDLDGTVLGVSCADSPNRTYCKGS